MFRPQRYKTNNPAVRLPAHDGNLSEVLVERDNNLMISVRVREDLRIAGITRPVRNALDLVSSDDQRVAGAAPDTAVEEDLHGSAVGQRWFNPFVADHTSCIDEARANIIWFEPRVALEDRLRCVARCQHPKHMLNGESMPADDWLAGEDGRVRCDAPEERVFTVVGHRWSPFTL